MVRLTDRLARLSACVGPGERIADIGTDHGLVPIDLLQRSVASHAIMTDINKGPLAIAKANLENYGASIPPHQYEFRQGDGLAPLYSGEVDTVILAGMGGRLIESILSEDPEKSKSIKTLILQPRNAQDRLRKFLHDEGYGIIDEQLVREGSFLCEILVAIPDGTEEHERYQKEIDYEISPLLIQKKDPLLPLFLRKKIRVEETIYHAITRWGNPGSESRVAVAQDRILALQTLLKKVENETKS